MTAVEAVAKAICCPDGCVNKQNGACLAAKLWFGKNATAAIAAYKAAIREPTEAMIEAATAAIKQPRMHVSHAASDKAAELSIAFRAMLDKAE